MIDRVLASPGPLAQVASGPDDPGAGSDRDEQWDHRLGARCAGKFVDTGDLPIADC